MLGMRAMRRVTPAVVIAVAAFVLAPAILITSRPAEAAKVKPETAEEVYEELGVDKEPADYVVLLDVSGSMSDAKLCHCYDQVSKALLNFFGALDANDRVLMIPFADSAPYPASVSPHWVTPAAGLGPLLDEIPPKANGTHTDIGLALLAAVTALESRDTSSIATVVMLTDGSHQPLLSSPYRLIGTPNWKDLANRAAALNKISLNAFAIPLNGADGVSLMATVFPQAEVLNINANSTDVSELTDRLQKPKAQTRQAKARALVRDDLNKGLEITWPALDVGSRTSTITLQIRSTTARVPLVLEGLTAKSSNPEVSVEVPDTVTIPPGGTVSVKANVVWDAGGPSWLFSDTKTAKTDLTLSGTVTSPWEDVLTKDLGLTFAPKVNGLTQQVTLTAQLGQPFLWYLGLAVFAVLAVAFAVWRYLRTHARMRGTVRITHMATEVAVLPLRRRRIKIPRSSALKGSGTIEGRWAKAGNGRRKLVLEIAYRPDGRQGAARKIRVQDGESVLVYGLRFSWEIVDIPTRAATSVATGTVLTAPTLVPAPRPTLDPDPVTVAAPMPSAVGTLDPSLPEPPPDIAPWE